MVELSMSDHQDLYKMLVTTPILSSERGREAVIENAKLLELRPHLQLEGPAIVVVPLMIAFLRTYGRLSYGHEPLGRFLATMKDYVGLDQRRFLDRIIAQYHLMTPDVIAPGNPEDLAPVSATEVLEKIIGENTLRPISFLAKGVEASRSVAYVEVRSSPKPWSGTGFMVSSRLLFTNHHVLPNKDILCNTLVRFNYQDNWDGNPELSEDFRVLENGIYLSDASLDFAVVEVSGQPGNKWGYLKLRSQPPEVDNRINIVQHPHGLPKQVSIQNNLVKYVDNQIIHYVTSTLPGSSGAPVLNDHWEVVGVHRRGGMLSESGQSTTFPRNEAVTIRSILGCLPHEVVNELVLG